ncbi:MAG: insulinase family protein [Gammaproteobacteria bacterium]|nr:insulinase family protein [Gammaproteobacteria bacterium]MCP5137328.1 insulinase family protein [Gammaproteobacteria bacterium]
MTHPAFEHLRTEHIESLHIDVAEYRHSVTGARHFHMAADDNNNAFLVAFLTVPQDSTGVAHILEHTSLCGSRKYPVRDPFFMMTRRSLNTFMNAFTASDWTAYPFASQNVKDFDNLLQVYLDAVFFPNLNEMDFLQEGHRLEFAEPENPDSELTYKGVVYNEMKGAMSSPVSALWQAMQARVFPSITYHYNSGGEPMDIPNLTWEQLRAFHARHYHPSNATFMTYGDLPAEHHQTRIQDWALNQFEKLDMDLAVPDEQRYAAPQVAQESYALDDEDTEEKTYVMLAWLLGRSADLDAIMEAHLLSGVLLDNSASPLRHALETSDLGTSPAPISGLDDSTREAVFLCGLEGSEPDRADAVEKLVLDVLDKVAKEGVPQEQVEAVLHQVELSQREVGGGHFPYGLQLMVNALSPALHQGDPVAVLNLDPAIDRLRAKIGDPGFIPSLVQRLLLDNPHRVRLTFTPDTEMSSKKAAEEAQRLNAIRASLDTPSRLRIVEQAKALQDRQMQADDPEMLPRVTLEDVPPDMKIALGEVHEVAGMNGTWYSQGTNGLVYQQLVVDLPAMPQELADLLPIFTDVLTEVGCGDRDYMAVQNWQSAVSGGINARISLRGSVDDSTRTTGLFVLSGKALVRNQEALAELLRETFEQARFDEHDRIRELIAQDRAHREAHITDSGHSLAMTAAMAGLAPTSALAHRWSGLHGIKALKALDDSLDDAAALAALCSRLEKIRDLIVAASRQVLLVGEEAQQTSMLAALEQKWAGLPAATTPEPFQCPAPSGPVREAWTTSTQVNFCAVAYPAVPSAHADSAALTVLGPFLRNGFLHRAVREQGGAYGGGAGYDSDSGTFRFYSYRDPRIEGTLKDFDGSLDWLRDTDHEARTLEEAILGVVASIDRPDSPAGEAVGAYFAGRHGRTPERRRAFRKRILEVTLDDLKRVADTYLKPGTGSVAVVSDAKTVAAKPELEFTVCAI